MSKCTSSFLFVKVYFIFRTSMNICPSFGLKISLTLNLLCYVHLCLSKCCFLNHINGIVDSPANKNLRKYIPHTESTFNAHKLAGLVLIETYERKIHCFYAVILTFNSCTKHIIF